MRTLCMFLASPNVRVLAVTCSNGVVDAASGYHKVKGLLDDLYHEGVLVGMDNNKETKAQNCLPALDFNWGGRDTATRVVPDAVRVIQYILTHSRETITFVSLGSLVTAGDCYKSIPAFKERVKEIIWTSDSLLNERNFNYALSPDSYNFITHQTDIPLHIVTGQSFISPYNDGFINKLDTTYNPYAEKVASSFRNSGPFSRRWFDEMAAVYLHYPILFTSDTTSVSVYHSIRSTISDDSIQAITRNLLEGNTVNQNQVLVSFPMQPSDYFPDVERKMELTLKKFGK